MELPGCPVCRNVDRKKIFKIPESSVYECSHCQLRYLDPCLSPEAMASMYESTETLRKAHEFHENYYDYGDLSKPSKTRADFERALALLERFIPSGTEKKIFDVGYGNGFFLALAQKRGWIVDGIDTSPQNADLAKRKFGLNLRTGTWKEPNSGMEKYHAISFWDVLEHLPNPHPMIQKAASLLAPGGVILAAIPNDRSFLMNVSAFLYRATRGCFRKGIEQIYFSEHVCYYRKTSLLRLFKMNGFEAREHFYSSTDLDKYKFSRIDKCLAAMILTLGKWLRQENRLIAFFSRLP